MARTISAVERSAVAALHSGHFAKFEVQDADLIYRDYTSYLRTDWFTGATIEEDQDSNTMRLNATLKREVGTLSLSPFRSDSLVNRNSISSYATAIDLWRRWKLSVAVMREGYPPTGTDWKEICQGRIDVIEWSGDQINITGRGEEAVLLDFWIATERQYGSSGGIAMETTVQSMMTDNLLALAPTLSTPVSPGYNMNPWTQTKGNLLPAARAVTDKAGAVIRYRYDSSDVNRLTLLKPNRAAAPGDEVFTLGPSEYSAVSKFAMDKSGVRNFIKLRFVHPTLGIQTVIYPHMAGTGTVTCAAGAATFSSSQAGIIKAAADGSNTEIIVAGIAYTVTAFNGTTGATLLTQIGGGIPTFTASSFTLHDTLSGAGTTVSLSRFGRIDMEIDVSYDSQVNDGTKSQGMCDVIGSDKEFPDVEQEYEVLGAWFIQLYDYGRFIANGIHSDTDVYGGVTRIRHEIADATIRSTIGVRGKPSSAYRTWSNLSRITVPSTAGGTTLPRRDVPYQYDGGYAAKASSNDGKELHPDVTDDRGLFLNDHYNLATHTLDDTSNGSTRKAVTAIDGAGKAIIDLSQAHTNKHLDNVSDGTTYKRVAGVSAGNQVQSASIATAAVTVTKTDERNRCRVYHSVNQTTNNSTPLVLAFDSESWDYGGLHSTVSSNSKINVVTGMNVKGLMLIAHIEWAANGTGYRQVAIIKNGTLFAPANVAAAVVGGGVTTQQVLVIDDAPTVGDYYEVQVLQTSGGNLNANGSGPNGSNFAAIHLW